MSQPRTVTRVAARFPWCSVKERVVPHPHYGLPGIPPTITSYDMWEWNTYKMKWVRLSNHGSGFGELAVASKCAKERSDEIQAMLDNNRNHPPAL